MNPDEVLLNVLKARDKASPSPSQEQSLRERLSTILIDEFGVHNIEAVEKLDKLVQESNRQAVETEAEWWRYQATCLHDELYDRKYNSVKVINSVMDDRIKALKDHQGGEI